MRRERERQPERRRQLRPEQARAQNPQRDRQTFTRDRAHAPAVAFEIAHQLDHIARELRFVRRKVAAQRISRRLVAPRRPPEPQIDPPREQGFQCSELFGDHQRRMIGQHHPARADPDGRGSRPDERQRDRGRGARDPRHRMMLGHPVARIAQRLAVLRKLQRAPKRPAGIPALDDRGKVENRQFDHRPQIRPRRALSRPLSYSEPLWFKCGAPTVPLIPSAVAGPKPGAHQPKGKPDAIHQDPGNDASPGPP